MPYVRLESSDGIIFDTDVEIAKRFGTLKTMLGLCDIEDINGTVIPLARVKATVLRKVLKWAKHHKDDPEPVKVEEPECVIVLHGKSYRKRPKEVVSKWDKKFLKVDQGTLFDLMSAANYLDEQKLLDLIGKTVAKKIKGKTPDEIGKIFNIKSDVSADEYERMREEEKLCLYEEADKDEDDNGDFENNDSDENRVDDENDDIDEVENKRRGRKRRHEDDEEREDEEMEEV